VTQRLDGVPKRDPELVALAARLLQDTDAFTHDVAARIRARVAFYTQSTEVPPQELQRSCRANVEFVLTAIRDDQTADVSAAEQTGRIRAEQRVPLPVVMAAFRVGFNQIWTNLVTHARGQGLVTSDALVDAASDIWSVHDTFAEAMATAYRETATAQALRDERQRSALVAAVLEGRPLNETAMWNVATCFSCPTEVPSWSSRPRHRRSPSKHSRRPKADSGPRASARRGGSCPKCRSVSSGYATTTSCHT
jgi:hypothetical protein